VIYPLWRSITLQTFVGPINGGALDFSSSPIRRFSRRRCKEANVTASFVRRASGPVATLWRVLSRPAGDSGPRRTITELERMSEYELCDIGLTRQDLIDATALPVDADPSAPRWTDQLRGTGETGRGEW
jgi:uncharacterized protein YjiS (DUF1127 family)